MSDLSSTQFVVVYADKASGDSGTANVYQNPGYQLLGTAKTAANGGETVPVIIGGVSDVHDGLVPGEMYYLQGDGSLGTAPLVHRMRLAISPSELLLDPLRQGGENDACDQAIARLAALCRAADPLVIGQAAADRAGAIQR